MRTLEKEIIKGKAAIAELQKVDNLEVVAAEAAEAVAIADIHAV